TVFGGAKAENTVTAAGSYNYAEALQKSMFFYEVQQAGVLPEWNEVSWRGDSMVNDVVPGGWFDAGDHLKFVLTNAYSATLLGWGLVEYGDAVKKAGLDELYKNNLKWGLDYIVESDKGDSIVYMIGEGSFDHVWWGSPEVYMNKYLLKGGKDPRPAYTCQDSCIEAQMACALAAGYMVFGDENYLKHAKDLFKRADAEKSIGDDKEEHPYYKPSSFYDDLFFAANWLYKATGEKDYLDKATSYVPNLDKEQQSEEMKFTWGHCWDDTTQGTMLLYAQNTGEDEWKTQFKKHLEYWTTGYGGKQISHTPDGLAWLFQWGSLRHATTTAFLASLASDTIFKDDADLSKKYNEFAKSTMDYCFGDNANKMSYVLGMGENNPKAPHHRAASGIHDDHWNELGTTPKAAEANGETWQTEYAHTLYGALVGGPSSDGSYKDQVNSYENSEVAIDYNAGFTAELCALIEDYGGTKLADFPEKETPKWAEWEVAAVVNGTPGTSYTELKTWTMNHTAWPARTAKDVAFRYYFDISEVLDGGLSVDDIKVETKSQQYSQGEPDRK
ncbi:MAG: glycoside hydrolase family 9 protein, partial [Oscillospiraceae bacterium]|nr:glycoside hydrolase family 9 protein [Oscillospiraceae bacterium]